MRTLGLLLFLSVAASAEDALLSSMKAELDRSVAKLASAEKTPLYFLSYQVRDTQTYDAHAVLGALAWESERRYRLLDVDARVGSRKFDNTHQLKGPEAWTEDRGQNYAELPIDDDPAALRAALWQHTDKAVKDAHNRYLKARANSEVTAAEKDRSDDFSVEAPRRHYRKAPPPEPAAAALKPMLERLSARLKAYPFLYDSYVNLSIRTDNTALVSSEGASVADGQRYARLSYSLSSRTEDGMDLERGEAYDGESLADLPSEETVAADLARSAAELKALVSAPVVEPYTGPAIIRNRAAGVYFHEILGHRLEGHRQKMEDEGQTFTKMLGKPVVAPFVSVHDDPTLPRFGGTFLRGHYRFDDEGVPAARATLIENGVLKGFLMSRLPIAGFANSNGHGRRSSGFPVVPRMASTIVSVSQAVPFPELRAKLVAELKRQGKPYGLLFEDIEGGFTHTERSGPQSFKVMPLLVYRVYADGRPDEAVRGVDIVGTPLTAFSKIIAAGDDPGIFNGTCGAESGWVPNSAVSPSLLISEIEVEKKATDSEKPPILPLPHHDGREARR